jgi:phosphoglycolate phosphatase
LLNHTQPYPDVVKGLNQLKHDFGSNIVLLICTNKPEHLAQKLVKHSVLCEIFNPVNKFVTGAVQGQPQKPNAQHVVRAINTGCSSLDVSADNILIVGDGRNDILVAHELNCKSIAVTYGFSDRNQLETLNPTWIADNFIEVAGIITKWIRL